MKIILILISILVLSASVVFAIDIPVRPVVPIIPETQGSVRKGGTAYVFGTETDAISAGSIYDLSRSFVSLGHTPYGAVYHMSVFDFGLAIDPAIFLGVAGGFNIGDIKKEAITIGNETITETDKPSFFATVALGVNKKFGFHYNIANATIKTDITDSNPEDKIDINATESIWFHQFSFAMRISKNLKYTIPVGVIIHNNETIKDTATEHIVETPHGPASKVIVYLNPNFTMYPDSGILTQFKAGLEVDFAVYDNIGELKTTTGGTTTTTEKNAGSKDFLWRLYTTPTFAWSFLDKQFRFMVEPTVAFLMKVTSEGRAANDSSAPITTTYTMTPSISAPVGVAYKPVEWFEFRSGLLYNLDCEIINTTTTGGDKTSKYAFNSTVMVFAGFGFIIAKDFLIDIAFNFGVNEFNLDALSLQLTYNF